MSIQDILSLSTQRELKTLIVDIERLPGEFASEFWDLADFKDRRISADDVVEWPRTISVAAHWFGTKDFRFHAVWDDGGEEAMFAAAFDLYDQADIVITYNGIAFDNKHLQSGWVAYGMGKPSPWKDIDLLKVARQSFGFESKTLDQVCKRLGIDPKNDRYSVRVARAAVEGDTTAQQRLARYNKHDVKITASVYSHLLPYIKGHPHVAPTAAQDQTTCPRCASTDVKRSGTYSPGVYNYLAYVCNTCGGNFRTTYEGRGPSVRAL